MFLNNRQTCLGLDIGTHTIKIIQISNENGTAGVNQVLTIPTPRNVFAEEQLKNWSLLRDTLKAIERRHKLSTKMVIGAVPEKHVITRYVRMPMMPEADLTASLKWEIEKYVPLSGQDLVMDMVNVGQDENGEGKETNVLLIAAPKGVVLPLGRTIIEAGWKLKALDTVPFALCRCFCGSLFDEGTKDPSGIISCLDMGASGTNVVIIREKTPVFSRHIPIGGDQFTNLISQSLELSPEEAEELKLKAGEILPEGIIHPDDTKNKLNNVLRLILMEFLYELRRCLDYVKIRWKGQSVERLYLTGGTALLRGLPVFLSDQLELPVILGELPAFPEGQIGISEEVKNQLNPAFAVALGLALRKVGG